MLPGGERDLLRRGGGCMDMGAGGFEKGVVVIQKMVEYLEGGGVDGW